MKKLLSILLEIFAYIMIAISFIIYHVQKVLNILVFWEDYPSYKKWLGNKEMNISAIIQTLGIIAYWLSPWTLFITITVFLLHKFKAINERSTN